MGKTPNYEPATRMGTLKWDSELAKLAEMNVRTCTFGHDNCMNTGKVQKSLLCILFASQGLMQSLMQPLMH